MSGQNEAGWKKGTVGRSHIGAVRGGGKGKKKTLEQKQKKVRDRYRDEAKTACGRARNSDA